MCLFFPLVSSVKLRKLMRLREACSCVRDRTALHDRCAGRSRNPAEEQSDDFRKHCRVENWLLDFFFFSKNEGAEEHFGFLIRPDRSVNANGHVSQQQHATHSRSARHVGVDPADAAHSKPSVRRQHFPRFPANEQINKSHSRPVKGETSYLVLRRGRG